MVRIKIAFCTGTRAEYGLLKPLMDRVLEDPSVEFQLFVTGMHLTREFGSTVQYIEQDRIPVSERIEILLSSDTSCGITKSMGLAMLGFAEVFSRNAPDIIILLGDRFETFCVASAALVANIPIVHLHGGELTEGAVDDAFRHAITKMSYLHFTSTEIYRRRVIQLGESPDRVFNVGAIGLENIKCMQLLSKPELEKSLGISFRGDIALITFHPETVGAVKPLDQIGNLFAALDAIPGLFLVFTKANADSHGREINEAIDEYVAMNKDRAVAFASLGQLRYLSTMKHSRIVIGNSSSGIIEAPSFKVPSLNIGKRQNGRVKAASVIDCCSEYKDICEGIKYALSEDMKAVLEKVENPYEGIDVSKRIFETIRNRLPLSSTYKQFYEGK